MRWSVCVESQVGIGVTRTPRLPPQRDPVLICLPQTLSRNSERQAELTTEHLLGGTLVAMVTWGRYKVR